MREIISVEKAIALDTDIVIMNLRNLFKAQETGMIEILDKSGIKTIFIDFRQRSIQHTVPSVLLLGDIFKKQVQARKVTNFYLAEMQKIYTVVAQIEEDERPLVFIERTAGNRESNVVNTWGSTNMGRFVELAGGKNYGTEIFGSKKYVITSTEQLLTVESDIITGTGSCYFYIVKNIYQKTRGKNI